MRNLVLKNRAIYFGINLLVMFSFLRSNFSLINLGIFAVAVGLSLYFSVFQEKANEPACTFFPVLLFSDVLSYFALHALTLKESFSADPLYLLSDTVIIAAVIGAVLLLIGILSSHRWPGWLGSLFLGAALLSATWAGGNLDLLTLQQPPAFKVLLFLHAVLATLWFFCVQVAERAVSGAGCLGVIRRDNWLTAILLCLFAAVNLFAPNWVRSLLPQWEEMIHSLPASLLVWWKILIAVLILSICAAALCEFKNESVGTDAYVMISFLGAVFLVVALYNCFFPLKWAVLLIYAQLVIAPIRIFAKGMARFRLRNEKYLAAALLLSLLGTVFLQYGLWLTLLITAAAMTAIYHLSKAGVREQHGRLFWIVVVLSIAAECAGLLAANRWHTANFILLTLTTVAALATMLILNLPHPAKKRPGVLLNGAVCVSFALVCTILAFQHGIKLDLHHDAPNAQIEWGATPYGADNRIVSLQYSWSEINQETPETFRNLRGTEGTLTVEGDRLTIEAVDQYGVRTTRTVWFLRPGLIQ